MKVYNISLFFHRKKHASWYSIRIKECKNITSFSMLTTPNKIQPVGYQNYKSINIIEDHYNTSKWLRTMIQTDINYIKSEKCIPNPPTNKHRKLSESVNSQNQILHIPFKCLLFPSSKNPKTILHQTPDFLRNNTMYKLIIHLFWILLTQDTYIRSLLASFQKIIPSHDLVLQGQPKKSLQLEWEVPSSKFIIPPMDLLLKGREHYHLIKKCCASSTSDLLWTSIPYT